MKFIRKSFSLFFLLLIVNFANASNLSLEEQIEADLFDFNPDITAMDISEPTITRATPATSISILTGAEAQVILQEQIYHRTNPITRKSVVDIPVFQHFGTFEKQETRWDFIPFYSQTFNERYYKDFDSLKDYINLDQEHVVRKLDDITFTAFDVPRVLQLFGKMKLQEHRIGIVFDWSKTEENWALSIRTPLYYDEHNFYLNTTEQDQITEALGVAADPKFAFDHLVADFFAIGDTKICFEYLVKKDHRYELAVGLRATIPTKIRLAKGIVGASFDVNKKPTSLDLHADVLGPMLNPISPTSTESEQAKKTLVNFGLDVLDHLSTILFEQGTRNDFHIGVGPQLHSTMHFNSNYYLTSLISLEVFTPAQERRFFLIKNTPNKFDWEEDSRANDKLAYLNTQLKEKFFPPGYATMVFPGVLLQSTSGLVIKRRRVTWTLGSDFWLHSQESFSKIYAPDNVKNLLDIKKAKMGNRFQSTLWIALDRNYQPDYKWQYGARLSVGTWSSGIGASTTFALYLEKMF